MNAYQRLMIETAILYAKVKYALDWNDMAPKVSAYQKALRGSECLMSWGEEWLAVCDLAHAEVLLDRTRN